MKNNRVQFITKVSMLAAIAAILMVFDFAIPFIPPFYKIDCSEVVVLLCGFALGPFAAVVCEGLKIILNFLIDGSTTYGVGEIANFIMGCSFILPATLFYHRHKSKKYALYGLILGIISLCIVASLINYFILLPAYSYFLNIPLEGLINMGNALNTNINSMFTFILFAVVPFNIIKGLVTTMIVLLIYKKVSPILKRTF